MKKLLPLMLLACGAPDNGEPCNMSIQEEGATGCGNGAEVDRLMAEEMLGRIDYVSPEFQEMVRARVMGVGIAEQAWQSAEYHGWENDADACYSDGGGDCRFPTLKQMSIFFDISNCFPPPVPLLKAQRIWQKVKEGILSWNGIPGGVTVEDGTCQWGSGNCLNVSVSCQTPIAEDPGALGVGGPSGASYSTRISNLPVGPHGKDHVRARVYSTAEIRVDPAALWGILTTCGTTTDSRVDTYSRMLGTHEMGHVFGFSHFNDTGSIMYPYSGCAPDPAIDQEYKDALTTFNSAGGANPQVVDRNLERWSP